MKLRNLFITLASLTAASLSAGTVSLSIPESRYVTLTGTEAAGYDAIYMVNGLSGVTLSYRADSPSAAVTVVSYTDGGSASATPAAGVTHSGATWTVSGLATQTTYRFTEGSRDMSVRVIDYTPYRISFGTAQATAAPGNCGEIHLSCTGAGEIITYGPTGIRSTVSRSISVSYPGLRVSEDGSSLIEEEISLTLPYISTSGTLIESPYTDADITLSGDRFSAHFDSRATTASCHLSGDMSVIAATTATRLDATADNSRTSTPSAGHFGGSGPVTMQFTAEVNPAATFTQWQVSQSSDFSQLLYSYPYTDFDYTFEAPGTMFVRFYANNTEGSCPFTGDTYTIDIGVSVLECPNAFSPNDDGVNDIWKVHFQSLSEFDCHIFTRSGQKVAHFTNPADGWDGKISGKKAPAGVYYYVIKARGTDGKEYKLSGDINIIYYR
ncbi:MAG: gliding motility-associated C-terminal domain-containing protein [Candidatus Amulumruptor caecigallinarius]|nr:gliding motility-associated C-terminal domain-containing protein [Candidatus Amulumruptor caecigallinarius]MCM1396814.1 gliding motility-associated C-terminal domain-containing protein [Candidatus Amulumruptor caecigallinarius]MCM1454242.1 gliding motility-associated C-terminal domain-containing protein [bacterium]